MDPGPISIIFLSPVYFTRTVYITRILLLFSTGYTHNLCFKQTSEIDNLIVSWEQSTWLCCVQVPCCNWPKTSQQVRPCWSAIKPVCITFSRLSLLSKIDNLGFLTEGKASCYTLHTFLLGFPTGRHHAQQQWSSNRLPARTLLRRDLHRHS
jgi:hypothetical protein